MGLHITGEFVVELGKWMSALLTSVFRQMLDPIADDFAVVSVVADKFAVVWRFGHF
jgi:hypothetical protein